MKCPQCGRDVLDGASLCRGCGLVIDPALFDGPSDGRSSGFTEVNLHPLLRPRPASRPSLVAFDDLPRTDIVSPEPVTDRVPAEPLPADLDPAVDGIEIDVADGAVLDELPEVTFADQGPRFTALQLEQLRRSDEGDATITSEPPPEVVRWLARLQAPATDAGDLDDLLEGQTDRQPRAVFTHEEPGPDPDVDIDAPTQIKDDTRPVKPAPGPRPGKDRGTGPPRRGNR